TSRLAAQAPQWEPGSAAGYHSLTQGFLVGEVIRRITGRSVGEFFAAEVAGPLGADFHIGLPAEHDHRVALTVPPPSRDEDYAASAPGSNAAPAAGTAVRVRDGNNAAWRRAQIPAASGFGNARSVALVQSALACGGELHGLRLLSRAGCDRAREEQFDGVDRLLGMSVRYGIGYGLFGSALGWGGWGGSIVMVEPDSRMAVAYVTNQMREPGDDSRGLEIIMADYDGLKGMLDLSHASIDHAHDMEARACHGSRELILIMDRAEITAEVAARLVAGQFPQWAHLQVVPVGPNGWDNTTFRLGSKLCVRLPSGDEYVAQ